MTVATIHKTLVELGILEPLKPGVRPSSKAAYLEKRRDAQRLRRKLEKEAREQGLEPKLKPVGRPPIHETPEEALQARRKSDRESKARQTERMAEAIKRALATKTGPETFKLDPPGNGLLPS